MVNGQSVIYYTLSKSSHFRMVEMADFKAYLHKVVAGLDSHVYRMDKDKVVNRNQNCTRKKLP